MPEPVARPDDYHLSTDIEKVKAEFLKPCGIHDYGIDYHGCSCPDTDFRPDPSRLVVEVEWRRSVMKAAGLE